MISVHIASEVRLGTKIRYEPRLTNNKVFAIIGQKKLSAFCGKKIKDKYLRMNGQNRNKEKLNGNKSQGKKRENKLTSAENGANF